MVHFLLYADRFDVEGLVSSPYGPGRREHILEVIDRYVADYPNLKTYSDRYPAPDVLRALTKQGAIESAAAGGVGRATKGSDWIVRTARRNDPRPLWLLVWGSTTISPRLCTMRGILPKLRVYFIGGPNKMWSVEAYDYIERQHPGLWMIEGELDLPRLVHWRERGRRMGEHHVCRDPHRRPRCARPVLRDAAGGSLKMGDTPSVVYLLHETPSDPSRPGWGGQFVRVWDGRKTVFTRPTSAADTAEAFGVVEFALPAPAGMPSGAAARMIVDGRIPAMAARENDVLRFRFSPRDAKVWPYMIFFNIFRPRRTVGAVRARLFRLPWKFY